MSQPIRLTQTVQKGGCAAKIAAAELRALLSQVRFPPRHDELLIDGDTFDDAAVYKVSDEVAMVQTIDFFTPIVDDPRTFGRIAACNAMSDVYAMGGRPVTALGVLAYPLINLGREVVAEVLQGASDMLAAAGACFVGGHSIDDDTLKFGLSVTGFVHPSRIWSNAGAKPGDALILTKPLGTGTLTAGLKRGDFDEKGIADALESMGTLNDVLTGLPAALAESIHAATDITGFGLSGHALQMARASGVSMRFRAEALPTFARTRESLEAGFLTKAHRTNAEYTTHSVSSEGLAPWQQKLIHDPQTSGGLLLAASADRADGLLAALRERFAKACRVGDVTGAAGAPALVFAP